MISAKRMNWQTLQMRPFWMPVNKSSTSPDERELRSLSGEMVRSKNCITIAKATKSPGIGMSIKKASQETEILLAEADNGVTNSQEVVNASRVV